MSEASLLSSVAVKTSVPDRRCGADSAHGLKQIVATFGDIYDYIRPGGRLDPRWQADYLAAMELPFPMTLSWDRSKSVNRMTCHKRMVEVFSSVFGLVQSNGLQSKISSFGGCFPFGSNARGSGFPPTVGASRLT